MLGQLTFWGSIYALCAVTVMLLPYSRTCPCCEELRASPEKRFKRGHSVVSALPHSQTLLPYLPLCNPIQDLPVHVQVRSLTIGLNTER
ncbi:hypothetical protein DFJ77DRAFT_467075 [Powellomyces hirtus]|nr:hypothetical protein DFJ77DRAFT_467075 [Powellomyces hirtus]